MNYNKCRDLPDLRAVLFDLDGTLFDSVDLILAGCRTVYECMGLDFDEAAVRRLVGIPLIEQSRMIADKRAEVFMALYKQAYRSLPESALFEATIPTLEHLKSAGYKLGVVTSKLRTSTLRVMASEQVTEYFDCIVTADDVENPKPAPDPVLRALSELKINANEALFVGDSIHDLRCGKAAGVAVAAVTWGAGSFAELSDEDPEFIFENWKNFSEFLLEKCP